MVCIYCDAATSVINSRLQKRLNRVWRRRKCESCNSVFTTHEQIDLESCLTVGLTGRELQPFSQYRLFISVYEACKHRTDAVKDAEALTQTIVSRLRSITSDGRLTTTLISSETKKILRRFDLVAETVYAAYHT